MIDIHTVGAGGGSANSLNLTNGQNDGHDDVGSAYALNSLDSTTVYTVNGTTDRAALSADYTRSSSSNTRSLNGCLPNVRLDIYAFLEAVNRRLGRLPS